MVELTAEQIAQRAFDLNLLDERQLQDVWRTIGSRQVTGEEFRQLLERRELLTSYQSERMLRGERQGFFYGDYKVLYLVGSGTFARVYRAAHRTTGEIKAIKVLRRKFSEDPTESDRFAREGQVCSTLRHPNIVPIYEVVSQKNTHFLVMDFVEGRNLHEFIRIRKKFDPIDATRLAADVASGLGYAFDRGICHRDLKMSNILVSSRGQGKLVDFGLAGGEAMEDDPEAANPRTIDYAALERATGVRKDDPRSDIYFLGVIYYHLLTGVQPIEARDRTQRLSKTRFQSVTPISIIDPTLPKSLVTIVGKAMELSPLQRYQSPNEMAADLKAALQKLISPDVPASPDTEVEAGPKPARAATPIAAGTQRSLMVVESNVELQNIFRERLKKSGYRVLVTQDPARALDRFSEDPKSADCVMFCTGDLGEPALDAFNQLGENSATQATPAVLLLGVKHREWESRAKLDKHRLVLTMPVKLRDLRNALGQLVPTTDEDPEPIEEAEARS